MHTSTADKYGNVMLSSITKPLHAFSFAKFTFDLAGWLILKVKLRYR